MDQLVNLLVEGSGLAAYSVASTLVNVTLGCVVVNLYRDLQHERQARLEQLITAFERTSEALDRLQRKQR